MSGYEIHDCHGLPQCGCEITKLDTWGDVEEYLEANPDVVERIDGMYAVIVEAKEGER